jgi:hypothetical protein
MGTFQDRSLSFEDRIISIFKPISFKQLKLVFSPIFKCIEVIAYPEAGAYLSLNYIFFTSDNFYWAKFCL